MQIHIIVLSQQCDQGKVPNLLQLGLHLQRKDNSTYLFRLGEN